MDFAMSWKLMIDDERDPLIVYEHLMRDQVYLTLDWKVARTVEEALALIDALGYPELISFDHDLGKDPATSRERPSGMDLAKRLVQRDMDVADMPADFKYLVHSMNGEGAANIRGLLEGYLAERTPGVPQRSPW